MSNHGAGAKMDVGGCALCRAGAIVWANRVGRELQALFARGVRPAHLKPMSRHSFAWNQFVAVLLTAVGMTSCGLKSDQVYSNGMNLTLVTVTRQSDGAKLYDGCSVLHGDDPIPAFPASSGELLTEHVSAFTVIKRTSQYNPALDDATNDSYWCSTQDNNVPPIPGDVGNADCYKAAGQDPPATVIDASLEYSEAGTIPIAVTRTLQVRHAGTLSLAPNRPCPGGGQAPIPTDELTILE